jgi:hypothetical protein
MFSEQKILPTVGIELGMLGSFHIAFQQITLFVNDALANNFLFLNTKDILKNIRLTLVDNEFFLNPESF